MIQFIKKRGLVFFSIVMLFPLFTSGQQAQQLMKSPHFNKTWRNYINFSLKFYIYVPYKSDNAFVCPWSVAHSMAYIYNLSTGQTKHEIKNVFGFPDSLLHSNNDYAYLQQLIDSATPNNIAFTMSKAIWLDSRFKFNKKLLKELHTYYGDIVQTYNAKKNPDALKALIKSWESRFLSFNDTLFTTDKELPEQTHLTLSSISKFDVIWETAFSETLIQKDFFYTENRYQSYNDIEYMCRIDSFYYVQNNAAQILEIPFKGEHFSMLIILPQYIDEYRKVEKNINLENYVATKRPPRKELVYVRIPRFSIQSRYLLKDVLQKLGMPTLFSNVATFSSYKAEEKLLMNEVSHTAIINVGLKGIKEGSALVESDTEDLNTILYFNANKPFMFLIRENTLNTILCAGRVFKPLQE